MPILAAVAVAGAATAATMAVAGVALATAVTYVGVGMSVVGAVTKNKNFQKVGAVMGLAGGVMNIAGVGTTAAAEAGTAAAGASAGETAIEAQAFDAAMASQGAAELAVTQADPFLAASGTGAAAPSALGSAADVASSASSLAAPSAPPVTPESVAPVSQTPEPASGLLNASKTPPPMEISTGFEQGMKSMPTDSSLFSANMPSAAATAPPPPSGISGWWASQSQPQKEMWMKAAASGVGSVFQGWSEEQKLALQREIANQNQANTDTRQANLNAQPTVQFRPVSGYPQRTGLLGAQIAKVGG